MVGNGPTRWGSSLRVSSTRMMDHIDDVVWREMSGQIGRMREQGTVEEAVLSHIRHGTRFVSSLESTSALK
jgi:hypothetical protein